MGGRYDNSLVSRDKAAYIRFITDKMLLEGSDESVTVAPEHKSVLARPIEFPYLPEETHINAAVPDVMAPPMDSLVLRPHDMCISLRNILGRLCRFL